MENQPDPKNRSQVFVISIIERIKKDKKIAAIFRRSDNPATEYQCWEYLAEFNIPLDKPYLRLPFVTIASAIAKCKAETNGSVGIGRALASCYENARSNDQAKMRLRRLLACHSTKEACRIMRHLFNLIASKSNLHLDFVSTLNDLLRFNWDPDSIKARWAQDFYGRIPEAEEHYDS